MKNAITCVDFFLNLAKIWLKKNLRTNNDKLLPTRCVLIQHGIKLKVPALVTGHLQNIDLEQKNIPKAKTNI